MARESMGAAECNALWAAMERLWPIARLHGAQSISATRDGITVRYRGHKGNLFRHVPSIWEGHIVRFACMGSE